MLVSAILIKKLLELGSLNLIAIALQFIIFIFFVLHLLVRNSDSTLKQVSYCSENAVQYQKPLS